MTFFNMFKAPYLDEIDNSGGGTTEIQQTQSTETTQQTGQPTSIRVKFNHEERDIPYQEAITHIQKGMNYDKGVERARQEARDSWISEQGYEWKGKPIKTEAEYKQALQEQELESKIRSQYSAVPDEIVNELLESRRFREETQAEKRAREESEAQSKSESEQKAKAQKESQEFLKLYKAENGKEFDPDTDQIPREVAVYVKQGYPLDYAYSRYLVDTHRASAQTQQANEKNAGSSTGSVKTTGKPQGYISKEDFNTNKHDQNWMDTNYDTIRSSMKHWK